MSSIRKILGSIGLVIVFIFLAIFSMYAYQDDKVSFVAKDKSPFIAQVFTILNEVITSLEKLPFLGLLPIDKAGSNYEQMMNDILTENNNSETNLAKPTTIRGFRDLWFNLRSNMRQEDWSRP